MPTLEHNERVKLLATTLNNIGMAAIAEGVLAPTAGSLLWNFADFGPG